MSRILKTVGSQIRAVRKAKGLSQESLAEKSGLHHNYIGGVERGERNVSLENLNKIAHGLGVRMHDLLSDAGGKDERLTQLLGILKTSDSETVDFVVDMAKRAQQLRKAAREK